MRGSRRSSKNLAPAASAVSAWLGSQELAQALRPHMARVHWATVVGEQIGGVTQIESIKDGVICVRVTHSAWANELDLLREDILRRLNLALGGRVITNLRFKVGLEPEPAKPLERVLPTPTEEELALILLPAAALSRAEKTVAGIRDEALRERFQVSLLRIARIEEWKRQHGWRPCSRCTTLSPPEFSLCDLCRAGIEI